MYKARYNINCATVWCLSMFLPIKYFTKFPTTEKSYKGFHKYSLKAGRKSEVCVTRFYYTKWSNWLGCTQYIEAECLSNICKHECILFKFAVGSIVFFSHLHFYQVETSFQSIVSIADEISQSTCFAPSKPYVHHMIFTLWKTTNRMCTLFYVE